MSRLLFKEGQIEILCDDVGSLPMDEAKAMMKLAATTCYQKREESKASPDDFVKKIIARGHYSVLEHGLWRTFEVHMPADQKEHIGLELHMVNNNFRPFYITERARSWVVSGNARMFREAFLRSKAKVIHLLYKALCQEEQDSRGEVVLFPAPRQKVLGETDVRLWPNPILLTQRETLVHRAVMVESNLCSRAYMDETRTHRSLSALAESTRYVDYKAGLRFVLPGSDELDLDRPICFVLNKRVYCFTPQGFTDLMEGWYAALRRHGFKAGEARQWLPLGLVSQIVQTGNLAAWRHWFFQRATLAAHPEIRRAALQLLVELKGRFTCFTDFRIKRNAQRGEFAEYTGDLSTI